MNKNSSIKIGSINLVESTFKVHEYSLKDQELEDSMQLKITTKERDLDLSVTLWIDYKSYFKEKLFIESLIGMSGEFKIVGEKPEFYETFCTINAPAIIFPFIREHLSSLTCKAGINVVTLPTFNFVVFSNLYKSSREEDKFSEKFALSEK